MPGTQPEPAEWQPQCDTMRTGCRKVVPLAPRSPISPPTPAGHGVPMAAF